MITSISFKNFYCSLSQRTYFKIPQDLIFLTFCLVIEAAAKMRINYNQVKCYFHFFYNYYFNRKFTKNNRLFNQAGCKYTQKMTLGKKKFRKILIWYLTPCKLTIIRYRNPGVPEKLLNLYI
jgi:hypothetical protein